MRHALEEITEMLQDLPSPHQHHQQQHRQKHRQASPPKQQQQQQLHNQPQPHTVNVPVTISMAGEGARGLHESPPVSPGSARDPTGEMHLPCCIA
jgi:hypothetical protein